MPRRMQTLLQQTVEPTTDSGKPRGYVIWACGCCRLAPYYEAGVYVSERLGIDPNCPATHGPLDVVRSLEV